MDAHPKTIQIFLPDGEPRGIRMAEITTRVVRSILVPRNKLQSAARRLELANVGVYFLFGESEEQARPSVYVGEAEDCLQRIGQHNKGKDFWRVALVAISKTQYFTKTHVKYLEWYCHQSINRAGRYRLENTTVPTCPYVSESMKADLEDNFDTLQILVSTLGYPLFDEIKIPQKRDLLVCRGKDAEAKGEYTEDGLVVFQGSKANVEESKSAQGTWVTKIRRPLIDAGILVREDNVYQFTRNHVFSSPSAAAVAVLARNANGWLEWKYADGRTLDEVKRREPTNDA